MNEKDFLDNLEDWALVSPKDWGHLNILAYFCYKYNKVNGVRFRLVRSKNGPVCSKESRDFSRLFKLFAPENYKNLSSPKKKVIRSEISPKIYNYINWMFDYKFRRGKNSVNGTSLFLSPSMINEFERMYSSYLSNKTKVEGVESLLTWVKDNIPELLESHQLTKLDDLKMIKAYSDNYGLDSDSSEVKLLNKASSMGLKYE